MPPNGADPSNARRSRVPRASRRGHGSGSTSPVHSPQSPAGRGEALAQVYEQSHHEHSKPALPRERKSSLNSRRTLQFLNRAIATEKLRTAAPLWSFKTRNEPTPTDRPTPTIAAASREQVGRLYDGPTVRSAGNWEARHDSPGPQAYNEGEKWRDKFRNVPSVRIDNAVCERHMVLPSKPGPGDYDIAHHGVGQNGGAVKFGDPEKKYPPRTPSQPRAEIPCSYAEPKHMSCLSSQLTSNRTTAPAVFFGSAPRFQKLDDQEETGRTFLGGTCDTQQTNENTLLHAKQEGPKPRGATPAKRASPFSPKSGSKVSTKVPSSVLGTTSLRTPSAKCTRRRGRKRRKRRRGGPAIFRRGKYDWLTSSIEPRKWEPRLKLVNSTPYDGDPPLASIVDPSRSRALTERNAPRPVLRRGERHNQSEYNPLRRTLPREKDGFPGPKYDRPPGAFGRTGGGGGTTAPSPSIYTLDRFPRGRLFVEEEMREREATPGPEAYDVGLDHRLERHSLEVIQGSLETLASWGELGLGWGDGWPFIRDGEDGKPATANGDFASAQEDKSGNGIPYDAQRGACVDATDESRGDKKRGSSRKGVDKDKKEGEEEEDGEEEDVEEEDEEEEKKQPISGAEVLEGLAKRTIFGRSRCACFAGASSASSNLQEPNGRLLPPTTAGASSRENYRQYLRKRQRQCSRLSPALAAAAWRGVPCARCMSGEVATTLRTLIDASASLSELNLSRRARTTGVKFRFGDMPRQRSAPVLSIGKGERDVCSRLMHTTPAEIIYKEARLGRCGNGPTTASSRVGDSATKPRSMAARVILPQARTSGVGDDPRRSGNVKPAVNVTSPEGEVGTVREELFVVDGALGAQVKSYRPTSPSYSIAGPRRAATLFHERLRYGGKPLSAEEQDQASSRTFFNAHVPTTATSDDAEA